jgi:hypothetical protein
MFRLLTLRVFIASLKRAVAISDRLKPATWKKLAITLSILTALSLWGFLGALHGTEPVGYDWAYRRNLSDIPTSLKDFTERVEAVAPTFSDYDCTSFLCSRLQDHLETTYFTTSDPNVFLSEKDVVRRSASYLRLNADQFVAKLESLEGAGLTGIKKREFVSSFLGEVAELNLERNAASAEGRIITASHEAAGVVETGPVVMMGAMPVPPAPTSSPATLPLWVLLATFIFNSLSAVVSWIFTLISLNRGKTDQLLKEAQLYKLRLEIAQLHKQMERDAQQTAVGPAMPLIW